ncbi:DUF4129 domain-containing protein [Phytoactinopolyspora endophytica]|uniref:DUF4129 domain-containing protein n=1 Tax=Phytoactinopolyspora endophytica TaxID=1642495 RepID=UPI00101C88C9|nr:DUF4129 domain-containing protein [Phytoactinopolyspora endophytica]
MRASRGRSGRESDGDRSLGARLPALAALGAFALLVVGIIGIGRMEVDPPDWRDDGDRNGQPALEQPREDELRPTWAEEPAENDDAGLDISIPWEIALGVLIALIAAVVVLLLRRLPRGFGPRRRSLITGGELDDLADSADELRKAVRSAGSALDKTDAADPDAIIEAWLALEGAAAGSGAPRQPSQTPSEFTAHLLSRHHADADAIGSLRDLYHRARFSSQPDITAGDVDVARQALATILRTLQTPNRGDTPDPDDAPVPDGAMDRHDAAERHDPEPADAADSSAPPPAGNDGTR